MTKKMLLNSSQRKYLIERINKHASKLRGDYGYRNQWRKCHDEEEDPPEIIAAQKLIDDFRENKRKEEEEAERHRNSTINRYAEKLEEALLFEASETALRKVADFEEMTWEELESKKPTRSASPDWDREI